MDVLFLMSIFRVYPVLKMSFEHNIDHKNLLLSACFCWNSRLSLRNVDQKYIFGRTIGYGYSYLEINFIISKYLDYTQYHMVLLEQCGNIVAKVQPTVTWVGEDKIHVTRSRDWTTLLLLRKTVSALHF